jgi:hypothetical protein
VRCRPGLPGWFGVQLTVFLGGLIITVPWWSPNPKNHTLDSILFCGTFGASLFLGALVGVVYLLRAQVVADDVGLRWRGLRGWKEARWDEVTDFYDKRLQKGQKASVIETAADRLLLCEDAWTNFAALRECVARRAAQTPAREWAERGARPEEAWPLVFRYDTKENQALPRQVGLMGTLLFACYAALLVPVLRKLPQNVAEMGWAWSLGMLAVYSLVMLPMPCLLAVLLTQHVRETRKRLRQRITTTRDSLTFEDDTQRIVLPWQEIRSCYSAPARGLGVGTPRVVAGRQGTFDFIYTLDAFRTLDALITTRAPEAVQRGLEEHHDAEDLLARREPRAGERSYHYRTRSVRALLLLPTLLVLLFPLRAWLNANGYGETGEVVFPLTLAAIGAIFLLWAWWRYFAAKIRTDEMGIMQYGPLRRTFIAWGDAQDYYLSGGDFATFGNVIGSDRRIRFWQLISGDALLQREIARRATRSRAKEWKKLESRPRKERRTP